MRNRYSSAFVGLTFALSLSLAACGGAAGNGQAASGGSSSQEQTAPAADPAEKFVGSWKLAKAIYSGVTMVGNYENSFGTEEGGILEIANDGTGSMTIGDGDPGEFTWKLKDDTAITITPTNDAEESDVQSLDITYDEGDKSLSLTFSDEEIEAVMVFTADGTIGGLPEFDISKAKDVASIDEVAGKWNMCGVGMEGAYAFGEASALGEVMGNSFGTTLDIATDGTAKMGDEDSGKIEIVDGVAVINDGYMSEPIKLLGDRLIVDLSGIMGSEFFLMYSK